MNLDQYLVTKVAWYYYMEGMTQEQIAKELHLTRFKVIRMLEEARTEKVVRFNIKGPGVNCLRVEKELIDAYALTDAFVVPDTTDNPIDSLAIAASYYLDDKVQSEEVIGFGWGQTTGKTISRVKVDSQLNASFVSLTGGVKYYIPYTDNVEFSPDSLRSKLYVIPAPFFLSSEEMAARILKEPPVKIVFDIARTANFVLVGIGATTRDATVIQENILTWEQMSILRRMGAVGDILGQFFDADGNKLDAEIHKRIVGIDINTLKDKPDVIGVAAGDEKVEAIRGALRGHFIKTLITDESTAQKLLQ